MKREMVELDIWRSIQYIYILIFINIPNYFKKYYSKNKFEYIK